MEQEQSAQPEATSAPADTHPPRDVVRAQMQQIAEEHCLKMFRNIIEESHQIYPHLVALICAPGEGVVHVEVHSILEEGSPLRNAPASAITHVWRETPKFLKPTGAYRLSEDGSTVMEAVSPEELARIVAKTYVISGFISQARAVRTEGDESLEAARRLFAQYRPGDHDSWTSSTEAIREKFSDGALRSVLMFNMIDKTGFQGFFTYDLEVRDGDDDYVTGISPPRVAWGDDPGGGLRGTYSADPERPLTARAH